MRFLLDENISQTVSRGLRDAGHDVLRVLDTAYRSQPDEDVIKFASRDKRIIITHDKDFGNLLRFPVAAHIGVILVRLRNQNPQNTLKHVLALLQSRDSIAGKLVIIRESEYRIIG